jgi:hypothetical protein
VRGRGVPRTSRVRFSEVAPSLTTVHTSGVVILGIARLSAGAFLGARAKEGEQVTKAFFGKVMWVGRATTFCVGLAVVLAVAFGVGTTALAAVPGDPFKLGRLNTVDRLTSLAGTVAGPLLRLDNNGGGPALALESEAGKAPLTVNAEAGKAANLDADRLDGQDASAFLPAGGKAADAAHADTAGDADKVDGLDAYQFMRSATYYHDATSGFSSDGTQSATVTCPRSPRQFVAISGGASIIVPDTVGGDTPAQVPAALKVDRPDGYFSWTATASETSPYDGEWAVKAHVVCVRQAQGIIVHAGDE